MDLKLEHEVFRPPFILEDVHGASFINIKTRHTDGVPSFVLKNVSDFKTINCDSLPDKEIDKTGDMKF